MPYSVSEVKANLSALLDKVERGESVVLGRRGKPQFRIVPYDEAFGPRTLGQYVGDPAAVHVRVDDQDDQDVLDLFEDAG